MVSVPWTTTTPSADADRSPAHAATSTRSVGSNQAPGVVFSVSAATSATAARAGTARTRSAALSEGTTPPPAVGGVMVMVPPNEPMTTRGVPTPLSFRLPPVRWVAHRTGAARLLPLSTTGWTGDPSRRTTDRQEHPHDRPRPPHRRRHRREPVGTPTPR